MRYTTVIDITEWPALYRSVNARILYLHMVLKSGYHDHDRDMLQASIRHLAAGSGLTLSATRCALQLLQKYGMVKREGTTWQVKKWVIEQPITSRPKTQRAAKLQAIADEDERLRAARAAKQKEEDRKRQELRAQGKTPYMVYYEEQQQKAARGDRDAQEFCEKNIATYMAHRKQIQDEQRAAAEKKSN